MSPPRPEETEDLSDRNLGQVLGGRYRLDGRLGRGGMGIVYRATHLLLDRPVAVKLLSGRVDEITAQRFAREAKSASRLDHENCVRVLDFGTDGGFYLVMELLDGRPLSQDLRRGALPAGRVVDIGRQLARALAHAHEHRLVHRDLKPDNVLLVPRGDGEKVKVLDFGLARAVEAGATITEAGVVFGTPEYMSPEQISGQRVDTPSDVYALGVLLYLMATGTLPFQAADFAGLLQAHVRDVPVPPEKRRPDLGLPLGLSATILRCLAKDPAARPSAKEVADTIGAAGARSVEEHPTEELLQPKRRWSRGWIAGAGVAIVGTVAGIVAVTGTRGGAGTGAGTGTEAEAAAVSAPAAVSAAATAPVVDPGPAPAPPPAPAAEGGSDHLRQAARYRREGNAIKELYHLQQAVREEPRNPAAWYQLGAALVASGQVARGCAALARAGSHKPAISLREKACSPPD